MPREEYKPKDKTVLRMSRDGAVEDNLTAGTSERISKRLEDAQLIKPREDDVPARPEPSDALPVGSHTASPHSVSELSAAPASAGSVVAKTIITHKIRKAHQVEALDGTEVMEKAAETSADKPDLDAPAPQRKLSVLHPNRKKRMSVWMLPVKPSQREKSSKKSVFSMMRRARQQRSCDLRMRSRNQKVRAKSSLRQKKLSARWAIPLPPVFTVKSMRLSMIILLSRQLTELKSSWKLLPHIITTIGKAKQISHLRRFQDWNTRLKQPMPS